MQDKNKDNLDKPVTLRRFEKFEQVSEKRFKEFTDKAFETFATKEDIAHLPTKKDLEELSNKSFNTFATKEDLKGTEGRIIEKTRTIRDEILSSNDKIAGELSTVRQEQSADTLGNIRRDDKIEELDNRVSHVETKLAISPAGS